MRVVAGKEVLTELHELLHPEHCALVLVDLQRDFIHDEGAFAALGVDRSMYPEVCARARALLGAARARGVRVVHVQNTMLPGGLSDSPAQLRFNLRMHAAQRPDDEPLRYSVEGTWGHGFVAGLEPIDGEVVVPKHRSSGFWGTRLDLVLRSAGVKTVVMAGCTTEGCVESTARDAMFNDYYVVIATDCVGSDDRAQHEASLLLMRHRFDLADGAAVGAIWAT
jgi:nicotinamidase-related amidase